MAAIALSVRFLVNLAAGELLCIVTKLESNNSNVSYGSLAGPAHATLAAYAAQVSIHSLSYCFDEFFETPRILIALRLCSKAPLLWGKASCSTARSTSWWRRRC